MIDVVIIFAMIVIAISMMFCVYRLVVGPCVADRVLALDTIGINLVAMVIMFSMYQDTQVYLDVPLIIAILAFLGTISMSKFIVGGGLVDRNRN
ncbi:Na(+)/H(+) antiporter subunit F1 [Desulfuribacillus stibiiarsenatis]|nr:Na(+)/H(+) antiporter subunit F1 [Desulfuribacillus stibiiarsenatis]